MEFIIEAGKILGLGVIGAIVGTIVGLLIKKNNKK